jgi:hypothetical protein
MDRRKLSLLKFLLNTCNEGYKVIDITTILDSNKKYKSNYKLLEEDIEFLKKYKFIDVKYFDEVSLCVAIQDNSHIFEENLKSERSVNRKAILTMVVSMLFSGFMAFIGAFIAIIITR